MLYRIRVTKLGSGLAVVIKASTKTGCDLVVHVARKNGYRTCVTDFDPQPVGKNSC